MTFSGSRQSGGAVRPCPYCDGTGSVLMDVGLRTPVYRERCSMCDGTGKAVTTVLDAGDGMTLRVHGSDELSAEAQEALIALGRAAMERLDDGALDG